MVPHALFTFHLSRVTRPRRPLGQTGKPVPNGGCFLASIRRQPGYYQPPPNRSSPKSALGQTAKSVSDGGCL